MGKDCQSCVYRDNYRDCWKTFTMAYQTMRTIRLYRFHSVACLCEKKSRPCMRTTNLKALFSLTVSGWNKYIICTCMYKQSYMYLLLLIAVYRKFCRDKSQGKHYCVGARIAYTRTHVRTHTRTHTLTHTHTHTHTHTI